MRIAHTQIWPQRAEKQLKKSLGKGKTGAGAFTSLSIVRKNVKSAHLVHPHLPQSQGHSLLNIQPLLRLLLQHIARQQGSLGNCVVLLKYFLFLFLEWKYFHNPLTAIHWALMTWSIVSRSSGLVFRHP